MIYFEQLIVEAVDTFAWFALLQSRVHEVWARFFASSMKDDMRYTPSDCFETFPSHGGPATIAPLEAAGGAYFTARANLMQDRTAGLTAIYNRFNDPEGQDPAVVHLRELHAAMDRAVLNAYGWTDLHPVAIHERE